MFRRLTIRNKMALVLWGMALVAYAVTGIGVTVFQRLTLERRAGQVMEPYAHLVSVGAEAAVAFEDPRRAQEILDTLRANPQVIGAAITLASGRILAAIPGPPGVTIPGSLSRDNGELVAGDTVARAFELQNGAHLYLEMSVSELRRQDRQVLWAFGASLLVLLCITIGQLAVLNRTIVGPIASLAEASERVRTAGDYEQRLPAAGSDEAARLGQSFNAIMQAVLERETDLRRLTTFQRALLDHAAYGIVSVNPEGIVSSFNPAAERLLGYTAAEVIGALSPTSWHDPGELEARARRLSAELGEAIAPGFEALVARARRNLSDESELTFIRKDGTRVPVLLSVTALRDEHGTITGFVGLMTDLTERKRAEAALREKTAELDRYFTNALDLLCIADTDGHFRRLNPQWQASLGFSLDELEGRRYIDFVHPDDVEATLAAMDRLRTDGQVLEFVNRYRSRDGSFRWIEWRSFGSGGLVYSVAHDITEARRAEETIRRLNDDLERRVALRTAELQVANAEMESFGYSVSHDLRAPLRIIDGFSRILLEDYDGALGAEAAQHLHTVRAAAQRMGQMIDDILMLSRVTRAELRRAPVDLTALAERIVAELRRQDPERSVAVEIAPALVASADPSLMEIALTNLIGNAWKFTTHQPGARIEFRRIQVADATAFVVRDNGAGFDPQYAHKLFGAFQRLHSLAEFPGTGVGLATVHRIIGRHGGRVWAEGAPGQGASFYFTVADVEAEQRGPSV